MKKLLLFLTLMTGMRLNCQTLVMNEVSNGPSGNMEYVEFVVMDTTVTYNCSGVTIPPCIDIRGWIFDDNSGYHGAGGVASGCIRFSNNPFWSCMPVGTIILIYNDLDPNSSLPPIDTLMSDGNCRIVVPVNKVNWFDQNPTTPGAMVCSYPSAGWLPGGNWNTTLLANAGDCARVVNLAGCEVFSVCWGTVNTNTLIYFPGSAQDRVYYFSNTVSNNPNNQSNWTSGCADPTTCGSNTQTPGAPNNIQNAAWINSMNNSCTPIPPLTASISGSANGSCPCSATASVNASGSVPPYSYTWSPSPGSGQGTSVAGGLCTGTYSCMVRSNVTGCIQTITVSVNNGTVGTTAGNTGSYCSGATIQLNTASATSYTWSGPGGFTSNVQNPMIASSNPTMSGTYSVMVTVGSCTAAAVTQVTVNPSPTVTVNSATICAGQNATLTANGASTYTWSPGPVASSIVISPTVTTNYTVTGNNGSCSNTATAAVAVIADPTITVAASSNSLCSGSSVTLTATSSTGTYTWNTGSNTASIVVNPTVSGIYSCTAANACTTAFSAQGITVITQPTLSLNGSLFNICGSQNATITASTDGNLLWNTGATGSSIITNTAGVYTVTASNTCGNAALTATVNVGAAPAFSINSTSSVICSSQSATLNTTGSAGSFTWSTGATTSSVSVSLPGVYTATLTNSCGTVTNSFAVAAGPSPTVNLTSSTNTICSGGSATLTANGSSGTYLWSTSASGTTAVVNNSGIYTVTLTNSCGSSVSTVSITTGAPPVISISPSSTLFCSGQSATLTANGSAGTYSWTNGTMGAINSVTTDGIYTAVVSNSCGASSASIAVNFVVPPVVNLSASTPTICPGSSATLTANGNSNSYNWSFTSSTGSVQVVNTPGIYSVSSSNACGSSVSSITIGSSAIAPDFTFAPNGGTAPVVISFSNTSSGFNSSGWSFGNGQTSALANPASNFDLPGIYTVTLTITNSGGCIASITHTIEILDQEPVIIIPNVFTPNDDRVNDYFSLTISNVQSLRIVIFDRWGLQMFSSEQIKFSWDGTTGDGRQAPAGTYFYILDYKDNKGKTVNKTGPLQLFR